MAQTVKITPATGLLEFIGDNVANKPVLQHDNSGNLTLTLQSAKKFTVGGNLKVNGKVTMAQQTLTDGAAITWDFNSGANARVTIAGARTLVITNMEAGDTGLILVKQDAAGGRTLSLPGGSSIVGGGSYTASSAPNATDVLSVYYDGTTYWWTIGYNTVTPPLTSVGITGSDFVIANSPLTSNGNIGLALATVNSNVGQFGSASAVPVITVNAKGLITSVSTTNISIPTNLDSLTDVTISSASSGQLLQFNGSQWVNWTPNYLTGITSGQVTTALGYTPVPNTRTISINGTTYDLTADRTWTISTVDYVSRVQHEVKAGVNLTKGQAVYVRSSSGTNMIVELASNTSEQTSSKTMGLIDRTVPANDFANVVTEGLLEGLDTSSAQAGDPVWLGANGNLLYGFLNEPHAPLHVVFIGIVTRVNQNNGEIFVKVQNGYELGELHNVDLYSSIPVDGEILGFKNNLWVNKTVAGWLGYTPQDAATAITTSNIGSQNVLYATTAGALTSMNISQFTNNSGYITGYTETDTLASVTSRGATTSTPVTFNGNVTLGNSADLVFVDLAGTFPTSGKGFDWTLNNDGARIYAIQPSSDSIDLVFQLRDNATTNDRFVFWVDDWQGAAFDKYPLIIRGGTEFDLVDSGLFVRGTQVLTNARVLQNISGNISMFTNDSAYITNAALSGYATQTYVNTAISNLIDTAPSTLDTLNELAAALGDDPNFATTITTAIGNKVSRAGDTMSGPLIINTNVAGLILNRDDVSNYNGIYYSTANVSKWFIGMRENLGSNNHIHYSEELGRDILTLNVSNGNATIFGTISASNFSGSSSGTNTGDQTAITGNAGSATVLQTARTLTIGNTGKTFNGSANVAWSLAEIGAYAASNPAGYITGYTETDTLASVTSRGATTSTASIFRGGLYAQKAQDDGNYTSAALWTESYDNTTTGIAFHISGNYGGFLEMRTDRVLYWANNTIYHSGNLTNLNQLTNGPGYALSSADITAVSLTASTLTLTRAIGNLTAAVPTFNQNTTGNAATATTAGFADEAKWISFPDGPRDLTDRRPNWNNRSVAWDFVTAGTADGVGNYAGVMTFSPWDGTSGSTGDSSYQFAFINESGVNASGVPGLRLRNGIDSSWNEWYQLWHSGNLTNLNQLTNGPGYITGYTETDTLASVTGRGATTTTTLNLGKVITTGLYGQSLGGNNPIWQYDASNLGYGIIYNEGSPDTLRIDVSGQAVTGTPDFLVGPNYAQVNGNTVWHAGNDGAGSGLDADLLDGYHASGSVGANTVVIRDSNGYIYANYINTNVDVDNPSIKNFITDSGDGWMRKSSIAHVRNSLGNYGSWLTQAAADPLYVNVTGDSMTGPLVITGSTLGQELFAVNGVNGRLFTVTDDLSNSLFSVNTIAGLPVIEAFADNTVKLGPFSAPITINASGISTPSHGTSANWHSAYNDTITSAAVSGTTTKTLTLTQRDGGTVQATWTDIDTDTNTDAQTLSISGSTLSISGGNSITIPSGGISQATADGLYVNVSGDTMTGKLTLRYDTNADPLSALEIQGGGNHTGIYINPQPNAQAHLRFGSNGELKWQIRAPFQDGIDTSLKIYSWVTGDDVFVFDHDGTLTVNNRLIELSSIRYKTNVESLTPALDKVLQLRPVYYTKIGGTGETEIGLIAEEVEEIYPELIKYDDAGQVDGINYTRIAPILIKTIQEQQELIKNLTKRIDDLENR